MSAIDSLLPAHIRRAFAPCSVEEVRSRLELFASLVVARLSGSPPALPPPCPADEMAHHFTAPLPDQGIAVAETLAHIQRYVIPRCRYKRSPKYFAHIDLPHADLSIFSGLLIRALAEDPMAYSSSRAGTFIELQTIEWLTSLVFSSQPQPGGTMSSGGTQGTLQALLLLRNAALARVGQDVARDGLPIALQRSGFHGLRVLVSATAHPCIFEAVRHLGMGDAAVCRLPVDNRDRLSLPALEAALRQCERDQVLPVALVLTTGTAGIGAIDPIRPAIELARRAGVYVHVDAAHGGMLLFSPRLAERLRGIEDADTVIIDPHKILGLNQGLGTLLVRDRDLLAALGKTNLPYFVSESVPDLGVYTMDGSRQLNALGAWILLRSFGRSGYRCIVEHVLDLASHFAHTLADTGHFEVFNADADMNIIAFRLRSDGSTDEQQNRRNEALLRQINRDGEFAASWYRHPSGRLFLRAVFVNPATHRHHVEEFVAALVAYAEHLHPTAATDTTGTNSTTCAMNAGSEIGCEAP